MIAISMKVNGKTVSAEIDARTLLVEFLRDTLGLTGAHAGCNTSQCGACTVHVDGHAIKSCTMLVVECNKKSVTTIEGISKDASHPMQNAFKQEHGLQCGYCTPGMIMSGLDIARRLGSPDRATIRAELKGNICRCTGYHNIVSAIELGAHTMVDEKRGDDA